MTPRERVLKVLHGGRAEKMPFTVYEYKLPQCSVERELRNRGLCIVNRGVPVFKTHRPNVKMTQHVYWEGGKQFTRTLHETPVGTLSTLYEAAGFTSWAHEKMFKTPDDYKALLFYLSDDQYEPNYEEFAKAQAWMGEDVILRAGFGGEPLQTLIATSVMSMMDFCIQWMDNRDEILKLYDAIVERRRKTYRLVAESPATHANYGGNVVPEISGPPVFETYYLPHYHEAAEEMHKHGKLIGSHLDDDCRLLAPLIAKSGLDYIEAFTPAPTTDLTLAEARAAWPNMALWLNFPSQTHLKPDAEVLRFTVEMLESLSSVDGIIMGVTEDMPPERGLDSCRAIMDGLDRHAREHPKLYA